MPPPTRPVVLVAFFAAGALAAATCCGRLGRVTREAALGELQREVQTLKAEGEKPDPGIGIQSSWNVEAVDIREQPNDPAHPWAGTVRFKIENRIRDLDGSTKVQRVSRSYDFVYDLAAKRWMMQYKP